MKYFIKRLIWIVPTFFAVTILVFMLLSLSPRDPVESMLALQGMEEGGPDFDRAYENQYAAFKLDQPLFYFGILPNYYPKNYKSAVNKRERDLYKLMLKRRKSHRLIEQYLDLRRQYNLDNEQNLPLDANEVHDYLAENNIYGPELQRVVDKLNSRTKNLHYPVFRWNGLSNQYHGWISNFIKGDFGSSFLDGREVLDKVSASIVWTILMLLVNFFLTLILGMPLAIFATRRKTKTFGNFVQKLLLVFYAMPTFWVATLVIIFLTNNYYGVHLFSLQNADQSASFFAKISIVFPIAFIMTLAELAYFYSLLTAGLEQEKSKHYVATAKSKGLADGQIFRAHILKNAFISPITLLFGSIPTAIGGALILEVVFNIPGMGRLMYDSILNADNNVVYCIVCVVSILALLFGLFADLAYTRLNPKIRFDNVG